jgi:hypothetical protein
MANLSRIYTIIFINISLAFSSYALMIDDYSTNLDGYFISANFRQTYPLPPFHGTGFESTGLLLKHFKGIAKSSHYVAVGFGYIPYLFSNPIQAKDPRHYVLIWQLYFLTFEGGWQYRLKNKHMTQLFMGFDYNLAGVFVQKESTYGTENVDAIKDFYRLKIGIRYFIPIERRVAVGPAFQYVYYGLVQDVTAFAPKFIFNQCSFGASLRYELQ